MSTRPRYEAGADGALGSRRPTIYGMFIHNVNLTREASNTAIRISHELRDPPLLESHGCSHLYNNCSLGLAR